MVRRGTAARQENCSETSDGMAEWPRIEIKGMHDPSASKDGVLEKLAGLKMLADFAKSYKS